MKKSLLVFIFFFVLTAALFAEESVQSSYLTVTITGVEYYSDYKFIRNGMEKIEGVVNLLPVNWKRGEMVLKGLLTKDPASVANDIHVLVMDRYQFSKKEKDAGLAIFLKKF